MKINSKSRIIEKVQKHLSHALSLLVVFLLLTAAAAWTGSLFGKRLGNDKASMAQSSALAMPTEQQLSQLGIKANEVQLVPRDSASWMVKSSQGDALGTLISSAPYAKDVKGFAGTTPIYIYVDVKGKIKQIVAQDNAETPDFFNRAFEGIVAKCIGLDAEKASTAHIDAVSGATFSSKAIILNVQNAMAAYASSHSQSVQVPTIGWGRTIAVFAVLLLGAFISAYFRGNKRLRIFQLLLNVVVLGFWCGQFLSLSLLRGWIANGFSPIAYLPTLLVLAMAVLMPVFKYKHYYCSWVCPLGSLQEIAARMPVPKIHCSANVYKAMSRIRLWAFCLLMLSLWTGIGGLLLDYEPFTAFLVQAASPIVLVLASVIVVTSMFIPNVWCRCLCPMGMMLNISEK